MASRYFHHDSRIEPALDTLPQQTLIANYTDWRRSADELASDVSSARLSEARAAACSTRPTSRDYSTTSVLSGSTRTWRRYGWTVLDSEWEMYGQSRDGAVDVLRMPDDFDFSAADGALSKLGYAEPEDHGVRVAVDEALAAITASLTPQLTAVAVLPDDHLIVTSDARPTPFSPSDTIGGDQDSLLDDDGVARWPRRSRTPAVRPVDVRSLAAPRRASTDADPAQQALARQRISKRRRHHAGPRRWRWSIDAESRLTVVMDFSTPADAEDDRAARSGSPRARPRTRAGRSRSASASASVEVDGWVIVMVLTPRSSDTQLLRDLGRGGAAVRRLLIPAADN